LIVKGALPEAVTASVTDWPMLTVCETGCAVIAGAAIFTESNAALLVAAPAKLVTVTE
jgi:hypothetical protein